MLILSSAYLAPVQYYAHLYASPRAVEDRGEHFVKQTYRNRCLIATPTGPAALVVPVVRADNSHSPMRDIRISDHGNWTHLHQAALRSAYEGSPFFEYCADDLMPLYERPYKYLVDLNEAFAQALLSLLGLQTDITVSDEYIPAPTAGTRAEGEPQTDLRQVISPKTPLTADPAFHPQPYWQVFAGRTGFLPNLSILDLLFHMGNESRIVLRASISG